MNTTETPSIPPRRPGGVTSWEVILVLAQFLPAAAAAAAFLLAPKFAAIFADLMTKLPAVTSFVVSTGRGWIVVPCVTGLLTFLHLSRPVRGRAFTAVLLAVTVALALLMLALLAVGLYRPLFTIVNGLAP